MRTRTHTSPRIKQLGLLLLGLLAMGLAATGCGDDFGTECSLPDNDAVRAACTSSTDETSSASDSASCVVENIVECDARICARYRGSQPFCTVRCDGPKDTSCPQSAFCGEFVVGTGDYYCVKAELDGR